MRNNQNPLPKVRNEKEADRGARLKLMRIPNKKRKDQWVDHAKPKPMSQNLPMVLNENAADQKNCNSGS